MPLFYEIDGIPTPWSAPRFTKKGIFSTHSKRQEQVIWQLKSQFNHETITAPIRMNVTFYMPVPKSASKKMRLQMLNGVVHHIKKPDRSNLLKFIEDCLERAHIISNDSIIVGGSTNKAYSLVPKTIILLDVLETMGATYGNY